MKFMKTMPSFYLEFTLTLFVLFFEMPGEENAKKLNLVLSLSVEKYKCFICTFDRPLNMTITTLMSHIMNEK
jgi:hypothetical protein